MTGSDGIAVIGEEQLRETLTMDDALGAARAALRGYSEGEIGIVASVLDLDRGDVHIKGAHAAGGDRFVVKVASWVPAPAPAKPIHGGGSMICAADTGLPLAFFLDNHYLSSLRTAAASAVAVDLLARPESATLGVFGTGVQARMQSEAVAAVRPLSKVLVSGRNREAAERLVAGLGTALPGVEATVASGVEDVMERADVVVTTTASERPYLFAEHLRPGQHLSAIGADDGGKAELDASCFARADRVFVDSRAQSTATAELGAAIAAGAFAAERVTGEIGDVLGGRLEGRLDPGQITIAKMTGIGALDLSIAEVALEKCALAGDRAG